MAFKILITEGESPLGAALLRAFENFSFSIVCPEPGSVDWCDNSSVSACLKHAKPAVVINTLNWLATIDDKGSPPCLPDALAELSRTDDLTVIHLSSHEVFGDRPIDGVLKSSDTPEPTTPLGEMLLAAESAYQAVPRCLVLRLPWLIDGPTGLITQMGTRLIQPSAYLGVSDAWKGAPVSIENVSASIIAIIQQVLCGADNWGVMHIHASDPCSEAEFADFMARHLSRVGCAVGHISIVSETDRLMRCNGLLGGKGLTNAFGIQLRSWRLGSKVLIRQWLEDKIERGEVVLENNVDLTQDDDNLARNLGV